MHEPVRATIPPVLRERREIGPQCVVVDLLEARMPAVAEDREEVAVRETTDAGELQFQQCRLPRVRVDGVDARRFAERVVEHVAAGARDHDHHVVRRDGEGLAVDCGIFPAGVVDERASVDRVEDLLVEAGEQREFVAAHGVVPAGSEDLDAAAGA
jgi:hypothetical protein